MEKGQIILRLFIPTHEQATKAVHPGVRSFHHPAPGFEPGFSLDGLGLFSSWANMGRKAECVQDVAHLLVVIALVQTHALRLLLARLRSLDHDALDGRAEQFHIMALGSLKRQAHWHSMALGQHAPFHPALAPIRGMGSAFFPRPTELSPWPRPYSTTSSRSLLSHQTAPVLLARVCGRLPLAPIPESDRAPSNGHTARSGPGPATDSQFSARRRLRRHSLDQVRAAVLPQSDGYSR